MEVESDANSPFHTGKNRVENSMLPERQEKDNPKGVRGRPGGTLWGQVSKRLGARSFHLGRKEEEGLPKAEETCNQRRQHCSEYLEEKIVSAEVRMGG